jgi:hypothetical protein
VGTGLANGCMPHAEHSCLRLDRLSVKGTFVRLDCHRSGVTRGWDNDSPLALSGIGFAHLTNPTRLRVSFHAEKLIADEPESSSKHRIAAGGDVRDWAGQSHRKGLVVKW